jgi:hypothetical protein
MVAFDKIKEEVGFAKVFFSLAHIVQVSLLAWIVQSFNHAHIVVLSLYSIISNFNDISYHQNNKD